MTHVSRLQQISKHLQTNANGWDRRHLAAVNYPKGSEVGFVSMLRGWLQYADSQLEQFGSRIGDDYYTGDIWTRIGLELRQLLSADIGQRLDCGTLDGVILGALEAEGFDEEGERT